MKAKLTRRETLLERQRKLRPDIRKVFASPTRPWCYEQVLPMEQICKLKANKTNFCLQHTKIVRMRAWF